MAYPAVAVAQPHLVSATEMPKDDFKREKLSLPKLSIKAGDATTLIRTINEWLQKTTLALYIDGLFPPCNFGTKR